MGSDDRPKDPNMFGGAMKSFFAYEMWYAGKGPETDTIQMIPFCEEYYSQYERIYNECFYEMRKALDVQPYNFYSGIEQIREKAADIFLLVKDGAIVGGVGCYGTEIDDLFVNRAFQNRGYGKEILLWAIRRIRTYSDEPITIHVAEWNGNAVRLYLKNGFVVTKKEKVN